MIPFPLQAGQLGHDTGSIWPNVAALLRQNGTNGGTTFIDEKGATCTAQGGAITSTAQSKFNGSSGFYDGVDDRVQIANSARLDIVGDFTFSTWFYPTELGIANRGLFFIGTPGSSNSRFQLLYDAAGNISFFIADAAGAAVMNLSNISNLVVNTWNHVEATIVGATGYMFVNGALKGSGACGSYRPSGVNAYLGYARASGVDIWGKGYMADTLFVNRLGLHSTAFTVPSSQNLNS